MPNNSHHIQQNPDSLGQQRNGFCLSFSKEHLQENLAIIEKEFSVQWLKKHK
jgi:hypothetical protein